MRPQELRQGAGRGERCMALRGAAWETGGLGGVTGPAEADPGVYRGKASCGEARAGVGGCACGLQAATERGGGGERCQCAQTGQGGAGVRRGWDAGA